MLTRDDEKLPVTAPVTTPEREPTEAVSGLRLTQVPPAVASLREVVKPWHTTDGPVIGLGKEFTVT